MDKKRKVPGAVGSAPQGVQISAVKDNQADSFPEAENQPDAEVNMDIFGLWKNSKVLSDILTELTRIGEQQKELLAATKTLGDAVSTQKSESEQFEESKSDNQELFSKLSDVAKGVDALVLAELQRSKNTERKLRRKRKIAESQTTEPTEPTPEKVDETARVNFSKPLGNNTDESRLSSTAAESIQV